MRFGTETDTGDLTGTVVREAPVATPAAVEAVLPRLTGVILQRPPSFSAKKVAGERAYHAARRGEAIELRPVPVTVHGWSIGAWRGSELDVEVRCGGGTYVRALARDLGELADSAAHLTRLRRTRSGPFGVEEAVAIDDLPERGQAALLPPLRAVGSLPRQRLDATEVERIGRGIPVEARTDGERAALVDESDALLAIAERVRDRWQPRVVLLDG